MFGLESNGFIGDHFMNEVITKASLVVWNRQSLNPVRPLMITVCSNIQGINIVLQVSQDIDNPIKNELRN
jgi:hypothetical protein